MDTTTRMDFKSEFEKSKAKGKKDANALLFNWIINHRKELFQQLNTPSSSKKKDAPLKFWSFNPGNPDHSEYPESPANHTQDALADKGGCAYFITDKTDVKEALSKYSMFPHKYSGDFILSIDDEPIHKQKRNSLVHKLQDSQIETRMDTAVQISFANLQKRYSGSTFVTDIDIHEFFREVALRFTGSYFGIAEEDIFPDKLKTWGRIAFVDYIWKIHARHFVEHRPDIEQRAGAVRNLMATIESSFIKASDDSVIGRFREDPGAFVHLSPKKLAQVKSAGSSAEAMQRDMLKKSIGANILGSIQGLVDNVATSACYALNWLLEQADSGGKVAADGLDGISLADLKHAAQQSSPETLRQYLYRAHRADTPSPFLPRYAHTRANVLDEHGNPLSNVHMSCAIGAAMMQMTKTECEDPQEWDIRMGYGAHDCIGKYLGDELVMRALRKLLLLNRLSNPNLSKQWGWIVDKFTINTDLASASADRPERSNTYIQPSLDTGYKRSASELAQDPALTASTLQTLTVNQLNALPHSIFRQLDLSQLTALPAARIQGLGYDQVRALDKNLRANTDASDLVELKTAVARRISAGHIILTARATEPRPHVYSLWSHKDESHEVEDYTTWPGLTDRSFSARHLKPVEPSQRDQLPPDAPYESCDTYGEITALFKHDKNIAKPSRSSLLFPLFAQWFTDSFLRTGRIDRRRTDSNHEIDMCQIYGLTEDVCRQLRTHDGTGKLLSEEIHGNEFPPRLFDNNGNIRPQFKHLPFVKNGRILEFLNGVPGEISRKENYFVSGLERGNSTFGYSAFNTLFLREHNRICEQLKPQYPRWDDERLFQTARMIVTLIEMKIVIAEYINHISAPPDQDPRVPARRVFVFDHSYAESQNWYRTNHIAIEFNLLYRWHSLIPNKITLGEKRIKSDDFVTNNTPLIDNGLDGMLFMLSQHHAQVPGLYSTPPFLLAAEYQALKMSRDFRLAPYNEYRACFNLNKFSNISDLGCNDTVTAELERLYRNDVNKLDFLVGLYAEAPSNGRLFGELMSRMVAYDAFTQVLTNPLLSKRIFGPQTITPLGMEILENTSCLHDLWERNQDTNSLYTGIRGRISMDYPQSA